MGVYFLLINKYYLEAAYKNQKMKKIIYSYERNVKNCIFYEWARTKHCFQWQQHSSQAQEPKKKNIPNQPL
jgi:hypothetical protein